MAQQQTNPEYENGSAFAQQDQPSVSQAVAPQRIDLTNLFFDDDDDYEFNGGFGGPINQTSNHQFGGQQQMNGGMSNNNASPSKYQKEQSPSSQKFTEEEQQQILKQTRDVLSKVEATLKKNEESKRDMLLMEKASVSLDQKWQEFQDSFNRMNQALVKNIAKSMGIKAKDIQNLHEKKPKEPKHLPQQISIEMTIQKLRERKKVLVIQGSQGVNQIGDKSMFTLKNLNENPIIVWRACKNLIQEIQTSQSKKEDIDILYLIDEKSMFLSNSIYDNTIKKNFVIFAAINYTGQRNNKIHLNGLVNEMKCINKQCSEFNRGKLIKFNNLDIPQIQLEESKVQQPVNQTLQWYFLRRPQVNLDRFFPR